MPWTETSVMEERLRFVARFRKQGDRLTAQPVSRKIGAARGIRTPDPRFTKAVLYQLSYCGIGPY